MREKPSSRAIVLRSMTNEFPASAPEPGGQVPANWAEHVVESLFDEMVDVLGGRAEGFEPRRIRVRAVRDLVERAKRLFHLGPGENADGLQRFGPGAIVGNLVRQE